MKPSPVGIHAVLVSLLAVPVASAQARSSSDDEPLNRFSLSYNAGINLKASFKNVPTVPNYYSVPNQAGTRTPAAVNAGSTNAMSAHIYDDGYMLVDASGNALGYSSYWGYQNMSQIQNGAIVMNSTTPNPGSGTGNLGKDPQHGFELTYNRQLGRHNQIRWGLETGVGYMNVSISDHQSLDANYTLTSDAYALPPAAGGGLVTPPAAPYAGPYSAAPGSTLLTATPGRTVTSVTSVDSFDLKANVLTWKLGPYVEFPLFRKRLSCSFSGGLSLLYVNSQFSFSESVPRPGLTSLLNSGSGSHNDLLLGGYVEGEISYKLTKSWDVFAGLQYLATSDSSNTQNGKQAELDFGNSLFLKLGAGYRF